MKKLISILTVLCFAVLIAAIRHIEVYGNSIKDLELFEYYNEFEYDYSNINQKISDVDAVFVGKILKLEKTIKVNAYGFDEVFSIYSILVIDVLKGDISENKINIVFYGGIVDGTLYVSDYSQRKQEEVIPLAGEIYLFSCDYYPYFNSRNLNLDDIYYVMNPYSILYLEDFLTNSSISDKIISSHNEVINSLNSSQDKTTTPLGAIVIEPPGDDGGSNIPGSSFETAIPIIEGLSLSGYIFDSSNPVYYEFTLTSSELVTIGSSYNYYLTDVKGTLYTSGGGMVLAYDEDSGFSNNFLIEEILSPGSYVIAVESESYLSYGDFYIEYNYNSNCHCLNYIPDLLLGLNYDAVSFFNTLVLDSLSSAPASQYTSELQLAVTNWNSLGLVDILYQPNLTIGGDGFVHVYDIDDNAASVAMFIPVLNRIYFNSFFFDTWTYSERLKTVMHEIGHSLGLNEFNTDQYRFLPINEDPINVMRQGKRSFTGIGPCDRLVYLYKWGNY